MGFQIEHGQLGKRMVLTGPWEAQFAAAAAELGVSELEINDAKGWKGKDLGFLENLPYLKALEIIDFTLKDISPVHEVAGLVRLKVWTYCKTPLDFTVWKGLEDVVLEWRARAKSLFLCQTLRKVYIQHFTEPDLSALLALPRLESLRVGSTRIREIGRLPEPHRELTMLGIYGARQLGSLRGIEQLPMLTELEVCSSRKVRDIGPIAALERLASLQLSDDGPIESLLPLRGLRGLGRVLFSGTTNIVDGQIRFLTDIGVEDVSFQQRSHYDAAWEDFPFLRSHAAPGASRVGFILLPPDEPPGPGGRS